MEKILVIEDDLDLCEIMNVHLHKAGYSTYMFNNCKHALAFLKDNPVDLILLDIMLPDMNGIEACEEIRKEIFCPIIFMSAIDDEEYILNSLAMGGDDYIVKPIKYNLLLARIEANIRRAKSYAPLALKSRIDVTPYFYIDTEKRKAFYSNKEIILSPIEYSILLYFAQNPNKIITTEELFNEIWDSKENKDIRTVIVHISNLRKKLDDQANELQFIETVRNKGYIFNTRNKNK